MVHAAAVFVVLHFLIDTLGRKMTNNVDKQFRTILKRTGLVNEQGKPLFSLHDLRRSCATQLLRRAVAEETQLTESVTGEYSSLNVGFSV